MHDVPGTLAIIVVTAMYTWVTQSMKPVPFVPLHAQFMGDVVRKTAIELRIKAACNMCLLCDVGYDPVKVLTAALPSSGGVKSHRVQYTRYATTSTYSGPVQWR